METGFFKVFHIFHRFFNRLYCGKTRLNREKRGYLTKFSTATENTVEKNRLTKHRKFKR